MQSVFNIKLTDLVNNYGFDNVLEEFIALNYLIKGSRGKITYWAANNYTCDQFKSYFNIDKNDRFISKNISDFKIPIFSPRIDIKDGKLVFNKGEGCYVYFHNLEFIQKIPTKFLTSLNYIYHIDFWLELLQCVNKTKYSINDINKLLIIYTEILRCNAIGFHKNSRFNLYVEVNNLVKILVDYMNKANIRTLNYNNYNNYPDEIKDIFDELTEGKLRYHGTENRFHKINIKLCDNKYIFNNINLLLDFIISYEDEFNNILLKNIEKNIYNIIGKEKECTLTLASQNSSFINMKKFNNKIELLRLIINYYIGITKNYILPVFKWKNFLNIWHIVEKDKKYKVDICKTNVDFDDDNNDINYIFNKIEIAQTNLYDLVRAIGINIISSLTKTSNSFLKNNELKATERFVNIPIDYKLSNKYDLLESNRDWYDYLTGIDDLPVVIFNYTPISLFKKYEYTEEDLPKSLLMNEKYYLIKKMLF